MLRLAQRLKNKYLQTSKSSKGSAMEITGELQHFVETGIDYIVEEVEQGQFWVHMMMYHDEIDNVAAVLPKIEVETTLGIVLRFSDVSEMKQMPQSMIALRDQILHLSVSKAQH